MTYTMDQGIRVLVDFNAVRGDGTIVASARFASVKPTAGEVVVLHDPERNECLGVVEKVEGLALTCRLAWATWRPAVKLTYPASLAPTLYAAA
jgi:hypothetical protein